MEDARNLKKGDRVRIKALPPDIGTMPEDTRKVFKLCLGKTFIIEGFGRYGHVELMVGSEVDSVVGGFMNTIWVEPQHLELVSSGEAV